MDTGEAVIVYPSPPDLGQHLQTFLKTVRSGFLGDLLELTFERFPAVLFHYQSRPRPGSSLKNVLRDIFFTLGPPLTPFSYVGTNACPNNSKSDGLRMPLFSLLMGSLSLSLRKR